MSEEAIEPTPPEQYTLAEFGVTRNGDGAGIPEDDRNRDWAAYQVWLAEGNTPDPRPAEL